MVPGKFAEQLPAYVINGLINALQILPEDRTRTVEQLRAELSASPVAAASESVYTSPRKNQTSPINLPVINTPAAISEEDDEDDEEDEAQLREIRRTERKTMLKTVAICLAIGIVIFVILIFTVFRDDFGITLGSGKVPDTTAADGDGTATVPDFLGKNYYDVTSNPVFTSLYDFESQYEYSDEFEKNYIIRQSISAGTPVNSGTTIVLTVSKGKEQVELPADIIGSTYDYVYKRLVNLGFEVERKDAPGDGYYHAPDEVISVSPAAGKSYDKGTKVIVMVYAGAEEPETEEPTSSFDYDYDPPLEDAPPMDDPGLDYVPDENSEDPNLIIENN